MKPLALGLGLLALAACGPIKNLDPLGGLGGADNSRYGFEAGVEAWAPAPAADGGSCTGVSAAWGRSVFGQASLALEMVNMGNHYPANTACPGVDNAARAAIDLSGSPPDLTGKTVSAWVYLPSAGQAAADTPTQAQLYAIDNSLDSYANGPGVNLGVDQWTRVTFRPQAWAGPGDYNQGGVFTAAGFDPSAIKRLGVKISAAGAAPCTFAFSGVVLLDSVDW